MCALPDWHRITSGLRSVSKQFANVSHSRVLEIGNFAKRSILNAAPCSDTASTIVKAGPSKSINSDVTD